MHLVNTGIGSYDYPTQEVPDRLECSGYSEQNFKKLAPTGLEHLICSDFTIQVAYPAVWH